MSSPVLDEPVRPPAATPRTGLLRRAVNARNATRATALFDQCVVSGASFIATMLLGRVCGAEELGVYALAMTAVVLVMNAQSSLIASPYIQLTAGRRPRTRRRLAASAAVHTGVLAAATGGLLLAGAVVLRLLQPAANTWLVLTMLAAASTPILFREFARRMMFANLQAVRVSLFDLAASGLQIGVLAALAASGRLSAVTALTTVGGAYGAAAGWWLFHERREMLLAGRRVVEDFKASWRLGRWELANAASLLLHGFAVPWILMWCASPAATGIFVGCRTVVALARPFISGLGNVLEPQASRAYRDGGSRGLRQMVFNCTLLVAGVMTAFCLTAGLLGGVWLRWIFGQSEFVAYAHVLQILAAAVFVGTLDLGPLQGLRAVGRPDLNFRSSLLGVCCLLPAALVLVSLLGVAGGAWAMLMGNAASAGARWICFLAITMPVRRRVKRLTALRAMSTASPASGQGSSIAKESTRSQQQPAAGDFPTELRERDVVGEPAQRLFGAAGDVRLLAAQAPPHPAEVRRTVLGSAPRRGMSAETAAGLRPAFETDTAGSPPRLQSPAATSPKTAR